ncbi:hypothetical protein ABH920_009781 [Catenulispora sp. EB89]
MSKLGIRGVYAADPQLCAIRRVRVVATVREKLKVLLSARMRRFVVIRSGIGTRRAARNRLARRAAAGRGRGAGSVRSGARENVSSVA